MSELDADEVRDGAYYWVWINSNRARPLFGRVNDDRVLAIARPTHYEERGRTKVLWEVVGSDEDVSDDVIRVVVEIEPPRYPSAGA